MPKDPGHRAELSLRPHRAGVIPGMAVGAVFMAFGWAGLTDPALSGAWWWRLPPAAVMMVAGAVWLVRIPRLGVFGVAGIVTVRGHFWSRSIPRASVDALTDFPALLWRAGNGRRRWTPLLMFVTTGGVLAFVVRHNEEQLARLERWLRR